MIYPRCDLSCATNMIQFLSIQFPQSSRTLIMEPRLTYYCKSLSKNMSIKSTSIFASISPRSTCTTISLDVKVQTMIYFIAPYNLGY